MFEIKKYENINKKEFYKELSNSLKHLIEGETDWVANISNASSLLFYSLQGINWSGFYFLKGNELVLGPFQGKPACIRISLGKGVCGTAAKLLQTQIVEDVHAFPGHIACDSDSKSEIVIPIIKNSRLIGVLDIDSPEFSRFDQVDREGLQEFVDVLNEFINWDMLCYSNNLEA